MKMTVAKARRILREEIADILWNNWNVTVKPVKNDKYEKAAALSPVDAKRVADLRKTLKLADLALRIVEKLPSAWPARCR